MKILELLDEAAATRQFKRIGNKFKLKYRCGFGERKGRLVTNPSKCGMQKDPQKVRQGKISARRRKGERVRKTKLTKRKSPTKILQKYNRYLAGK